MHILILLLKKSVKIYNLTNITYCHTEIGFGKIPYETKQVSGYIINQHYNFIKDKNIKLL